MFAGNMAILCCTTSNCFVSYQEDERKDSGEKGLRVTNTMLLWQNALKKNQAT